MISCIVRIPLSLVERVGALPDVLLTGYDPNSQRVVGEVEVPRGVKDLLIAVRGKPLTHIQISLALAPPHMKKHILSILNITL